MDEANKIPNPYESLNVPPSSPINPGTTNTVPATSSTPKDNRTLVTTLLLIFIYPVGFFVMWFWSGWKVWVKLLVSFAGTIFTLLMIGIALIPFLMVMNPSEQLSNTGATDNGESFRAAYMEKCEESGKVDVNYCDCTYKYLINSGVDFSGSPQSTLIKVAKELPKAAQSCESWLK